MPLPPGLEPMQEDRDQLARITEMLDGPLAAEARADLAPEFVRFGARYEDVKERTVYPFLRDQLGDGSSLPRVLADREALRPFLADDVVYHNIPMDPVVGIEDTVAFLAGFLAMCDRMEIETTHLAVRDGVVLTERVDTFTVAGKAAALPVMGTFEIRDGKIAAWRDYFDMAQITAAWGGGDSADASG